uniref:Uncharacterized protein n=1 Tax=Anguilla anguilla TaxID=7936 RepID=A0A0E9WW32_ANGAN
MYYSGHVCVLFLKYSFKVNILLAVFEFILFFFWKQLKRANRLLDEGVLLFLLSEFCCHMLRLLLKLFWLCFGHILYFCHMIFMKCWQLCFHGPVSVPFSTCNY